MAHFLEGQTMQLKSPISHAWSVLCHDVRLSMRQSGDIAASLLFFILTLLLFPFGIGPDSALLAVIAPGLVWVAALLSVLLSLDRIFAIDYQDGSLELLFISAEIPQIAFSGKIIAHWIVTGIPLIILSPLMGGALGLASEAYLTMMLSLFLGTICLSFIGAIGASLTLGSRKNAVLTALLVLPLFIPVLIFGTDATQRSIHGLPITASLSILGIMCCLAVFCAPFACCAAIKQAIQS